MDTQKLAPFLAGGVVAAQAAFFAVQHATKRSHDLLRPPGVQDEQDFLARCIRCGRCIEACPYVCLKAANDASGMAVGTPVLNVRDQACKLCEDFPCVNACPTDALRNVESRADVDMGLAVIDTELCIAMKGMRCEVCYRVCPLIDTAITIDYRPRKGDSIHAIFAPQVDAEKCVGCGLCVERCVIDDPDLAIKIVRDREKAIEETRIQQARV
ncbi:MAG: 4Fe-4S binding protein [Coriobacteriales bacterium]|jgi:ferredoxin-type protein NapG|nr:4Fe-4S binding protein [Coriobacteriales bacterium]